MPGLKPEENPRWKGGRQAARRRYRQSHKERIMDDNHKYHIRRREEHLSKMKEYRDTHKEQLKTYSKEYLKDPKHIEQANKRAEEFYLNHRFIVMERQREVNRLLKIDALTHYGDGECACVQCGEDGLDCLSLDHINIVNSPSPTT